MMFFDVRFVLLWTLTELLVLAVAVPMRIQEIYVTTTTPSNVNNGDDSTPDGGDLMDKKTSDYWQHAQLVLPGNDEDFLPVAILAVTLDDSSYQHDRGSDQRSGSENHRDLQRLDQEIVTSHRDGVGEDRNIENLDLNVNLVQNDITAGSDDTQLSQEDVNSNKVDVNPMYNNVSSVQGGVIPVHHYAIPVHDLTPLQNDVKTFQDAFGPAPEDAGQLEDNVISSLDEANKVQYDVTFTQDDVSWHQGDVIIHDDNMATDQRNFEKDLEGVATTKSYMPVGVAPQKSSKLLDARSVASPLKLCEHQFLLKPDDQVVIDKNEKNYTIINDAKESIVLCVLGIAIVPRTLYRSPRAVAHRNLYRRKETVPVTATTARTYFYKNNQRIKLGAKEETTTTGSSKLYPIMTTLDPSDALGLNMHRSQYDSSDLFGTLEDSPFENFYFIKGNKKVSIQDHEEKMMRSWFDRRVVKTANHKDNNHFGIQGIRGANSEATYSNVDGLGNSDKQLFKCEILPVGPKSVSLVVGKAASTTETYIQAKDLRNNMNDSPQDESRFRTRIAQQPQSFNIYARDNSRSTRDVESDDSAEMA